MPLGIMRERVWAHEGAVHVCRTSELGLCPRGMMPLA